MMMRPRRYGTMNRSIARGVSYALRDNNRKNYKRNVNTYSNTNQDISPEAKFIVNTIIWFIAIAIVIFICCMLGN